MRSSQRVLAGTLFLMFVAMHRAPAPLHAQADRWAKEMAAFEQMDKQSPPAGGGIVFVGSSSIRLWDLARSFPGVAAVNRGFGGSQIVDSVHFAPRIVTKYKPRTVVFYAGDNDIGSGKSPGQVASDFRDFVKAVRKDVPKAKIVYISIKPSIKRWALWDKVSEANRLIAQECRKGEGLTFLDVGPAMLGPDGKPTAELFVADGLHLSEKGYEVWTRLLKPHLE